MSGWETIRIEDINIKMKLLRFIFSILLFAIAGGISVKGLSMQNSIIENLCFPLAVSLMIIGFALLSINRNKND